MKMMSLDKNIVLVFLVTSVLVSPSSALVIGNFEGSLDGWSPWAASAMIVSSDSYLGKSALEVSVPQATNISHGIFIMYPIGTQVVSAKVKVLSGQVYIMVCTDYAHNYSVKSAFVGPSNGWQTISVSSPIACNEICVYAGKEGAVYLVDDIEIGSTFPPVINNVRASQRADGSKLVDINFDLSSQQQNQSFDVQVFISQDGGKTFSLEATAITGHVGPNQIPGVNQPIVWDPSIDLQNVNGNQFVARVTSLGAFGDSNIFSVITTYGAQSLGGRVCDFTTGEPISGADVTLKDQSSKITGLNGEFLFENVEVGLAQLIVRKPGFYDSTEEVDIGNKSCNYVNISMMPNVTCDIPQIIDVRGKYCGPNKHVYYLQGASLLETFTPNINWNGHTPGVIYYSTPLASVRRPADMPSVQIDMGSDVGVGSNLVVEAESGDATPVRSKRYIVNFDIIPPPPLSAFIPASYYKANPVGNSFEYQILGFDSVSIPLAAWGGNKIPSDFPVFGGNDMEVGCKVELSGSVDSQGTMELFSFGFDESQKKIIRKHVPSLKGIKLPYAEITPSVSIAIGGIYSKSLHGWLPNGTLELGCEGKVTGPQMPFPPPIPPIIYWRPEVALDLGLNLGIKDFTQSMPNFSGNFEFEPQIKGIIGVGNSNVIAVEGYVGGGFHGNVAFLPEYEWEEVYAIFLAGFNIIYGPYTSTWEIKRNWWPDSPPSGVFMLSKDMMYNNPYHLFPRKTKSCFDHLLSPPPQDHNPIEQVLHEDVFPYSFPKIIPLGDNILVVWISDDTSRSLVNRTELTFDTYHNGVWESSKPIENDGTADLNPQITSLGDGHVACIWQDLNTSLADDDNIDTFHSHTEISVSLYNGDDSIWSDPIRLTDNSSLDRSPQVAGSANNDMLAVWINNPDNDLWGSSSLNNIMWSYFDNSAWSAPTILASGVGMILDTALVYNGTTGTFVFCADADDNFATPQDQELWLSTYSQGVWSIPTQLTNDQNTDSSPRLLYDPEGSLYMAWIKDNDIRFASGTDVTNSVVIANLRQPMQAKDFDLIMGATGQIAMVWSDVSQTYNDIFVAYYDPVTLTWSSPRQITSGDATERFITSAFDTQGNLFCVYDKNHTQHEDQITTVNGQLVTVKGVPKAGQSDLMYLQYTLSTDLSVSIEDVSVDPANREPGTNATITAKIKNIGESPAQNIQVAFYDGNPQSGGTLIDAIKTITDPIAGGQEATTSVTWTVPQTTTSKTLYVVVDPTNLIEDRNRSNNSVNFQVLSPDIAIKDISVQRAGSTCMVTARIANEGTIPAKKFEMELRRNDPDHTEVLGSRHFKEILPRTYQDVPFMFKNLPFGLLNAVVEADKTNDIDEFSEDNNIRSFRIENYAPADFDQNGKVDLSDLSVMVNEWLRTDDLLTSDIAPLFLKDGKVDLADFAELARYWTE